MTYNKGRAFYLQEQKVKRLERELRELQRDEEGLAEKITQTERKLVADGIAEAERQRLLKELRHYEQMKPENRAEYHQLSRELHWEQQKLDRLQLEQ
ncbi:MAG: hypothetical protein CSA61_01340 [Neptuniibacter caesariensis]|uniref:Uncharacterized protein n=1 Tax=Neptuniibacter caesariensis TaxID=207954 RepID=A0A2G6JDI8_NEPCE|nr:MAG: hypothetical protein CSA61_01340 [Neptuniibacter caesariensis]